MRIVIVAEVFLPKIDGVVGRTVNLIQQLLANGDEVIVVCPKVAEYRNSPVPLIEFPSFPFPRRLQGGRRTQTNAPNNCT